MIYRLLQSFTFADSFEGFYRICKYDEQFSAVSAACLSEMDG